MPICGLVNGFFLELVESWIKPYADLEQGDYHVGRAAYLEGALKKMLAESFPGCDVRSGTTWTGSDDYGQTDENDCLVVCGPLALVFKSEIEQRVR